MTATRPQSTVSDTGLAGFTTAERPYRIWKVKEPLFEELLSDQPMGHSRDGMIYWPWELWAQHVPHFCLQFAVVHTDESYFAHCRAYNLHPLIRPEDLDPWMEKYKREGIRPIYTVTRLWEAVAREGVPLSTPVEKPTRPYFFDPRAQAAIRKGVSEALTKYGSDFYAVMCDDELIERVTHQTIDLYERFGGTGKYPFIDQCAAEVKSEFGFGKYSLPRNENSGTALDWLATRRWVTDRALRSARQIRDIIRQKAPGVLLIGYDPMSSVTPMRLSLWGDIFDIVPHQCQAGDATMLRTDESRWAFITKYTADLCGAELWPIPHLHNQMVKANPPNYSADECVEILSQLVRNGAVGLDVWTVDQPGRLKLRQYTTELEMYGAPDRFFTELDAGKIIANMNRLKSPKADFAVLYSNDANMAIHSAGSRLRSHDSYSYAYAILGMNLGGWFRFVGDDQIEDEKVDLSQFNAVFLPYAQYQRESVVKRLSDYVAKGGTLVSADPTVWRSYDDGESGAAARDKLFGVIVEADQTFRPTAVAWEAKTPIFGDQAGRLPLENISAVAVQPAGTAGVLARFEDGRPAAILNHIGRGRAVFFAFNPFVETSLADKAWMSFFRTMCLNLGLTLDQPIWRFKLPDAKFDHLAPKIPKDACLTGNYLLWWTMVPYSVRNSTTGGTYALRPAPDAIPDTSDGEIPFSIGKITNRLQAPTIGNYYLQKGKLSDWVVQWKKSDEVEIIFDFKKAYPVSAVKLFYQGQLPRASVAVRQDDGAAWQPVAEQPGRETKGVGLCQASFQPALARWVKVTIGKRDVGKPLLLSEVEVWGEDSSAPTVLKSLIARPAPQASIASPKTDLLEVGFATKEITPGLLAAPDFHRDEMNIRDVPVRDRLYTRATVFRKGTHAGAWVSLDLGRVDGTFCQRVANRLASDGVSFDQLVIGTSHTHCAASIGHMAGTETLPEETIAWMAQAIAETLVAASRNCRPAAVAFATADVSLSVNRWQIGRAAEIKDLSAPSGLVDPLLTVVAICQQGNPHVGLLFNYAAHPLTMLGVGAPVISADYPGRTVTFLEGQGAAFAQFFQGCAGNVNGRIGGGEGGCNELARRLGEAVGQSVGRAVPSHKTDLRFAEERVRVPYAASPSAEESRRLLEELRAVRKPTRFDKAGIEVTERILHQIETNTVPTGLDVTVRAMRVGDGVFLALPGEVFAEIGLGIRKGSGVAPLFLAGYTNESEVGYVPTAAAFKEGGYEITNAPYYYDRLPLTPACEQIMVEAGIRAVRRVTE